MLLVVLLALQLAAPAPAPATGGGTPQLTEPQAVALAVERNRELISARLQVEATEIDRRAAGLLQNPDFSFGLNNLVIPPGNRQDVGLTPGFFSQPIIGIGVSQTLDIWAKRGLRQAAIQGQVDAQKLQVDDVLREVTFAVRSAFADVLREQDEYALAKANRERYDQSVQLTRKRFQAGDIAESELNKFELEALRYTNAEIEAQGQLADARAKLAGLLLLPPEQLPPTLVGPDLPAGEPNVDELLKKAEDRPDVKAAAAGMEAAKRQLSAAEREKLPDLNVGLTYYHDQFTVSGDNPNTLALNLGLPIPLFDRNQAGVSHAELAYRQAENDRARLLYEAGLEVRNAARSAAKARALLDIYEHGMLDKADLALKTAEAAYQAGAISQLELLEAQRTWNETRGDYLEVLSQRRQALLELAHAAGVAYP